MTNDNHPCGCEESRRLRAAIHEAIGRLELGEPDIALYVLRSEVPTSPPSPEAPPRVHIGTPVSARVSELKKSLADAWSAATDISDTLAIGAGEAPLLARVAELERMALALRDLTVEQQAVIAEGNALLREALERMTPWHAPTIDEAIRRAEKRAEQFAVDGWRDHGLGVELFSRDLRAMLTEARRG